MITQRLIDEWHVEAQDYRDQIRSEFLQGLMGNRKQPQMMQQGQQQGAPQQSMMQPQQMQQGQMPMNPMMAQGGQNG